MARKMKMFCCQYWLCLGVVSLLAACVNPSAKRTDVLDIYEMPRATQGRTIYVAPTDNDSYYTQPGGYVGCGQIGDAPSCGGG